MKNKLMSLVFLLAVNFFNAQNIENRFAKLTLPNDFSGERVDGTNEDLANIDIYQIKEEGETSFLIYVMSNKLNVIVEDVSSSNFMSFLADLGDINVAETTNEKFGAEDFFRVKFNLLEGETKLVSSAYIKTVNDILYRIIFMFPKDTYYNRLSSDVDSIMETVVLKREKW